MIVDNGKYYLYRHIRLDKNEPFYIGVATKYPEDYLYNSYSRANKRAGRNRIWKGIVSRADYDVEILLESDSRDFILQKEIEFVRLYGRINKGTGILANLTDGGDYFDGYVDTGERGNKISQSNKGRKISKESSKRAWETKRERAKIRGYYVTEDVKKVMSEKKLGRKLSKESIEKRTKTSKENAKERGFWHPKESYIKAGETSRSKKLPIERRLILVEELKKGIPLEQIAKKHVTCFKTLKRLITEYDIDYINPKYKRKCQK